MNIIQLSTFDKPAIESHLYRLNSEDRRLRFCSTLTNVAISNYVEALDPWDYAAFGAYDGRKLIAFLHVGRCSDGAEIGISVDEVHRGSGIARSLLQRAHTFCLSHGVHELYMSCLSENRKMQHLARSEGLQLKLLDGEYSAAVTIDATPAKVATAIYQELYSAQVTLVDSAFRALLRETA